MKQNKNNQAFTLVELLVVISIIGLLSTVVVISFGGAREKAFLARVKITQGRASLYCSTNPVQESLIPMEMKHNLYIVMKN